MSPRVLECDPRGRRQDIGTGWRARKQVERGLLGRPAARRLPIMQSTLDELIVCDAGVLGGKPCIRGTRVSVQHVLEFLASGQSREAFLEAYPHVRPEGFAAALHYAAKSMQRELTWEEKRSA